MREPRKDRVLGIVLVILGAVPVSVGVVGMIGFACPTAGYFCPLGGCAWVPGCQGWQNYVLLVLGGTIVVPGTFLISRSRIR